MTKMAELIATAARDHHLRMAGKMSHRRYRRRVHRMQRKVRRMSPATRSKIESLSGGFVNGGHQGRTRNSWGWASGRTPLTRPGCWKASWLLAGLLLAVALLMFAAGHRWL